MIDKVSYFGGMVVGVIIGASLTLSILIALGVT